ncbi:MAG TPA: dienelactone hydrolase family protein [Acidimicrobiales bacterium]|nr:dienelactone hydrolase family protein [Acidimicrobiales bacterium]
MSEDVLAGFDRQPFTAGPLTHDVYRCGSGPAVLVLHEIPGMTPKVVAFARRVVERGMTAVLPHLFGTPGRAPSGRYAVQSLAQVCISREFSGLALGRSAPIVDWLRALARAEHARCGGPGVGVVGMCYTGGFGLAMAVDDAVLAPVLSQPSLPFPIGEARRKDIQLSAEDWRRVTAREDLCVLGLRFSGDKAVPPERFETLRARLGDRFISVVLDSSPGNPHGHPRTAHSVLTEHLDDREGTPTREALEQVLRFLAERLGAD